MRGHDSPIVLRPRDVLAEPLRERARLVLARRLEARLRGSSAVRGAALVLHGVAPTLAGDPRVEIEPAYGLELFEALVRTCRARYRLVTAVELLGAARARRPGEPVPVALTFDDDLRSHLDHAAPVLARHGAPATAFLGGVDEAPWWRSLQAVVDARAVEPDALPPLDPAQCNGRSTARRARPGGLQPRSRRWQPDERAALAERLAASPRPWRRRWS